MTNRLSDENLKDYQIRLCRNKDLYNLSWDQVAELLNRESGKSFSSDKYRKWFYSYQEGYEDGKSEGMDGTVITELDEKKKELQKERIKLSSERVEINKALRENARSELFEEKLIQAVEQRKLFRAPDVIIIPNNKREDYLFPIADAHYGVEFEIRGWNDEILNQYNPEIFEERMWSLLEQFVLKNDKDRIDHVHLVNLSDSIDGILRMSQLQSLRYGVVDSAIEFGEFMSTWINELSKYAYVDYYSLQGNHNEIRHIGAKRGDFPHENTEKWNRTLINANLRDNQNVTIHPCKPFLYKNILGTHVLGVHGQDEKNLENSIKDYALAYNKPVDLLLSGHLHSNHSKTIGMNGMKDIEFVQCTSICGIDDYSMKLKKTSNAGAKLMILEEGLGRTTTYDFKVK